MSLPTEQEIRDDLKKLGRNGCNKCYSRGYVGWTDKQGVRIYIVCGKCKRKANEDVITLFEDKNWIFACNIEPEKPKLSKINLDQEELEIIKDL